MVSTEVRPPPTGYPAFAPYPQQQPNPYGYPAAPDPHQLPPPIAAMSPYNVSSGLGHRRGPLRPGGHGASPYPHVPSVVPHVSEVPVEPVMKRKCTDAEQLKVLNETYNHTAFPSTEERIELAKKLGMSARSVQIWCVPCSRSPSLRLCLAVLCQSPLGL